jgi:hypothetical protein
VVSTAPGLAFVLISLALTHMEKGYNKNKYSYKQTIFTLPSWWFLGCTAHVASLRGHINRLAHAKRKGRPEGRPFTRFFGYL